MSAKADLDRLIREGNAAADYNVIAPLGLLEDNPGILVGEDDLAGAGVERYEPALVTPEVGSDRLHLDRW